MDRPLADRIRPQTLEEVVGQRHLLGPDALLRRFIEKGTDANMVFYGPSGTGKTTIANIIARQTHRTLYRLNATTASLQDIKDIIGEVGTLMAPGGVLLYLDEIQYFNKKQQQSLLEFMENGSITLIASTTENPYFYGLRGPGLRRGRAQGYERGGAALRGRLRPGRSADAHPVGRPAGEPAQRHAV